MPLYVNGTEVKELYFNGNKLQEAWFNGVKVYESWRLIIGIGDSIYHSSFNNYEPGFESKTYYFNDNTTPQRIQFTFNVNQHTNINDKRATTWWQVVITYRDGGTQRVDFHHEATVGGWNTFNDYLNFSLQRPVSHINITSSTNSFSFNANAKMIEKWIQ